MTVFGQRAFLGQVPIVGLGRVALSQTADPCEREKLNVENLNKQFQSALDLNQHGENTLAEAKRGGRPEVIDRVKKIVDKNRKESEEIFSRLQKAIKDLEKCLDKHFTAYAPNAWEGNGAVALQVEKAPPSIETMPAESIRQSIEPITSMVQPQASVAPSIQTQETGESVQSFGQGIEAGCPPNQFPIDPMHPERGCRGAISMPTLPGGFSTDSAASVAPMQLAPTSIPTSFMGRAMLGQVRLVKRGF
jgi:hypothetical protein